MHSQLKPALPTLRAPQQQQQLSPVLPLTLHLKVLALTLLLLLLLLPLLLHVCACFLQAVVGDYIAEEPDALDDPMRFHLPLSFGEQRCCPSEV
jgi:hypothetical protein